MSFEEDELESAVSDGAETAAAASGANDAISAASAAGQAASTAANLAQAAISGDPSTIASSAMTDAVAGANQLTTAVGGPDIPDVPSVPGIPSAPSGPDVPSVPNVPGVPGAPSAPSAPSTSGPSSLPSTPSAPSAPAAASPAAPPPTPTPAAGPAPPPPPATSAGPSIEDYANIGGTAQQVVREALTGEEIHQVYVHFEARTEPAYEWIVGSFSVQESIGAPYAAHLVVSADSDAVDATQLLGKSCVLTFLRAQNEHRVCGMVQSVSTSVTEREAAIEVVPALAFGALRRNTRIFQKKSVRQILEQLLPEILAPYDRTANFEGLQREYPECEFRTQYDETDLAFCQRLMEEEGIFYWFDHAGEAEELLLFDHASSHPEVAASNGAQIEFTQYGSSGLTVDEAIRGFTGYAMMRPTALRTRHYDWTKPGSRLEAEPGSRIEGEVAAEAPPDDAPPQGGASGPEREVYEHDDWPLTLSQYDDGQHAYQANDVDVQVRIRRELLTRDARTAGGSGTVVGFSAGMIFELFGHPQPALDGRWLLTSVTHSYAGGGGEAYTNNFTCQPADVPFRLTRRHLKPQIAGVQTGTVVGPSGAEIDTDFHGRVRVQFHWDREGERNEHSSCYIRVIQPWAGQGWGFVFLPRIGMEVVVSFIGGDPDRPLVTGTVYNGENTTNLDLTEAPNPAVSYIRTRSTPESEGFNELKFDDNKDEEQVYIHAQKDFVEEVLNDHNTTVKANQSNTVDGGHTESVGGDQTLSVNGKRTKTVEKDETNTIKGARTHDVTGLEKLTLHDARETTITKTDTLTVTQKQHEALDGGREIVVKSFDVLTVDGGNRTTTVHGQYNVASDDQLKLVQGGANYFYLHGKAHIQTEGETKVTNGATMLHGDPGGKLILTADSEIVLSCGASSITLKKDGTIEIVGKSQVTVSATKAELVSGPSSVAAETAGVTVTAPKIALN